MKATGARLNVGAIDWGLVNGVLEKMPTMIRATLRASRQTLGVNSKP